MANMNDDSLLFQAYQGWARETHACKVQKEAERAIRASELQKQKDKEKLISQALRNAGFSDDFLVAECFRCWFAIAREGFLQREHDAALQAKLKEKDEETKREKLKKFTLLMTQNDEFLLSQCFRAWALSLDSIKASRALEFEQDRLENELAAAKQAQTEEMRDVKLRKFWLMVNVNNDWLIAEAFKGWRELVEGQKEDTVTNSQVSELQEKLWLAQMEAKEEKIRKVLFLGGRCL